MRDGTEMIDVLLLQLPIPQLNYGKQTGNVPLGAACLKQAAEGLPGIHVDIFPESVASYLGDAALIELILSRKPDILGFSVYCWNAERSLFIAEAIKEKYQPKIIFGGPEITKDNRRIHSEWVDFFVYGEGESVFTDLLRNQSRWIEKSAVAGAEDLFKKRQSPYLLGFLEPDIENMILLETQRGCPYRCGYCYYGKSRDRLSFTDPDVLFQTIQWAHDRRIREVYLLDPSLNSRPDLKALLRKISRINRDKRLEIISEIRAEGIDVELADLFAAAGFSWFEIGLQSTNPEALKIMNRPTHLKKFLTGSTFLKERGILPRIDLIAGLPGDNLNAFKQSVDFLAENDLKDDVQVFPLLVLPGTDFRRRSIELGLNFEASPPYPVIDTTTFSREDMLMALDYAETLFDMVLYPMPDLDAAWRDGSKVGEKQPPDHWVRIGSHRYISKLGLNHWRSFEELESLSKKLTHPYQIIVGSGSWNLQYIRKTLEILTSSNPFTPLELVFIEPETVPDTRALLPSVKLRRPHYLDHDLRFLFAFPGNRAVLFTLVSQDSRPRFSGVMERQVFWWRNSTLPKPADLEALSGLDGILIDSDGCKSSMEDWQDRFAEHVDDILFVSFADRKLQKRWMELTVSDDYYFNVFSD